MAERKKAKIPIKQSPEVTGTPRAERPTENASASPRGERVLRVHARGNALRCVKWGANSRRKQAGPEWPNRALDPRLAGRAAYTESNSRGGGGPTGAELRGAATPGAIWWLVPEHQEPRQLH